VLLIVIAVANLVFGKLAACGASLAQFRGLLGKDGADSLQKIVAGGSDRPASLIVTAIVVVTLILTASGVFLELEDALNACSSDSGQ
jgi:membrane protein